MPGSGTSSDRAAQCLHTQDSACQHAVGRHASVDWDEPCTNATCWRSCRTSRCLRAATARMTSCGVECRTRGGSAQPKCRVCKPHNIARTHQAEAAVTSATAPPRLRVSAGAGAPARAGAPVACTDLTLGHCDTVAVSTRHSRAAVIRLMSIVHPHLKLAAHTSACPGGEPTGPHTIDS